MIKKSIPELMRMSVSEFQQAEKLPLCLVADNVRSRHNIGAMFRTADAFRLDAIYLCGISPVPPDADIHKTALGAELAMTWYQAPDTVSCLEFLRREGWTLCALEQAHDSLPLHDFNPPLFAGQKIALIVGNEVEGVSEEALALCHHILEIPQQGTKHSLNVSVSAGIALYHLFLALSAN